MKSNLLRSLAWLLVLSVSVACHKNSDDSSTPIPAPTCTLSSFSSVVNEVGAQHTYLGQFTFDADNHVISSTDSYSSTGYTTLRSQTFTDYRYDGRGFLTEQKETYTSQSSSGNNGYTHLTTFSYTDDRISQLVQKNVSSSGTTVDYTETFQYDGQGKLAQYVSASGSGSSISRTIYLFSAGLLTSISKDGKELYQIENGRIAGTKDGTSRYEYDGQGRRVRSTHTSGASYKSVSTYEYEPTGHQAESLHPLLQLKGMYYNQLRAIYGYGDDLVKRETVSSETNGKVTSTSETTYTYQLNGKGYPLSQTSKAVATYTDPSGANPTLNTSSTTTLQYTYRTCD